jgi:glyoxylase-like metal-dependent hydrolase (beta-lactamase superfamily II)
MIEIKELDRDTYLVDCGEIPVYHMPQVSFLVVGDTPVLIEPGSTTAVSRLLEDSNRLGLNLDKLSYIIPTHVHVDHGGGAGYLARNLPGARVVLHPRGARAMMEPSKLVQATRLVMGEHFEEAFGPILPIPEDQIHVAQDGEVIRLGTRGLTIFYSPGHASHHISVLDSLTGGLFCGEALGFPASPTSDVVLPAGLPPFDPERYLESIEKLGQLRPGLLFYSHIGARSNTDNHLIEQVRETSTAFDTIVRAAVGAGESDDDIRERLSDHVRARSPEANLEHKLQLDASGYIDYYRNRRQK